MVDREARDKLRQALASMRAEGSYDGKFFYESMPKTKDRTPKRIHGDLWHYLGLYLPSIPDEDPRRNVIIDYTVYLKRAELFLASDLEYVDPDGEGWNWSGVMLLGGAGLFFASLIVHAALDEDHESWLRTIAIITGIVGGVSAGLVIIIVPAIICILQGIHVFRVRILREDRSIPEDPEDFWPFVSREQFEKTLEQHPDAFSK